MQQISVKQLASQLASNSSLSEDVAVGQNKSALLLDVREPWEFETCHIPGSVLMPMHTVPARMQELEPDDEIICICHHGGRSMQVVQFLMRQGFSNVINLTGGVHAWAKEVDPAMPTY
jgi:rhodanese-related sulfurtransferase